MRGYLEKTLASARRVITDLGTPAAGGEVEPGDLVRESAARLPD